MSVTKQMRYSRVDGSAPRIVPMGCDGLVPNGIDGSQSRPLRGRCSKGHAVQFSRLTDAVASRRTAHPSRRPSPAPMRTHLSNVTGSTRRTFCGNVSVHTIPRPGWGAPHIFKAVPGADKLVHHRALSPRDTAAEQLELEWEFSFRLGYSKLSMRTHGPPKSSTA